MFQESKELIVTTVPLGRWYSLAQAIREGCKRFPIQAFGYLTDHLFSACAVGAADAAGYRGPLPNNYFCPQCSMLITGPYLIAHINDTHRWTRESIAHWLESI